MGETSDFPFLHACELLPEEILKHGVLRFYRKGRSVLPSGRLISELPYIFSGCVRLFIPGTEGNQKILYIAEEGHFCGEAHYFSSPYISVTAETMEDSELVFFSRVVVERLLAQSKVFRDALLRCLSRKALIYGNDITAISYENGPMRLYRLLVEIGRSQKCARVIVSQVDLGMMCGVHRVTINRWSQVLKQMGLVRTHKYGFILRQDGE